MLSWFTELTRMERKGFYGAFLGHAVDVFDFMIYSFLISTLLSQWNMSKSEAGAIVTYTLVSSLVGAILAGMLADRYGRVRVLRWTIVVFALACFLCGWAQTPTQLMIFRIIQGLGFGGESVAVHGAGHGDDQESRPSRQILWLHRKQLLVRLGRRGAGVRRHVRDHAAGICVARLLFLGILPALVVVYLRRNPVEPELYVAARAAAESVPLKRNLLWVFQTPLPPKTILCSLLSGGMLGGYYAIATWLPTYLKLERGLSVFGTSPTSW